MSSVKAQMTRTIVHLRDERLRKLLLFSLLQLMLAHGALTTFLPVVLINVGFVLFIVLLIYLRFREAVNYFDMFLVIYVLSHFNVLQAKGGLGPLVGFVMLVILLFGKHGIQENMRIRSRVNLLVGCLFFLNVLGWFFKPTMDASETLLGCFSYAGYVAMFLLASGLKFDLPRIGFFIKIIVFMAVYESCIALNTYLGLVKTGFFIPFPAASRFGSVFCEASFNHSELFGEWSLLLFLFLLPFLAANKLYYNVSRRTVLIGVFFSALNVFLSGSRSTFALMLFGGAIVYFSAFTVFSERMKFVRLTNYLLLGMGFLFILWAPLNLGYVIDRFDSDKGEKEQIEVESLSWNSLVTGEGTPREGAFIYFFKRYETEKDTWMGHGFGTPNYNRTAWFGTLETRRADYHSLYLTIIITYGWVGAGIYILIFFYTIWKLYRMIRLVNKSDAYVKQYFYPLLGFLLMFVFMLINEYKISLMRVATYHMITWMWLGLAHALIFTVQKELNSQRAAIEERHLDSKRKKAEEV